MYEARIKNIKKKPIAILDKRFKAFKNLQSGESGNCIIEAEIFGDRLIPDSDGTEYVVKILEAKNIELINADNLRT